MYIINNTCCVMHSCMLTYVWLRAKSHTIAVHSDISRNLSSLTAER